MRCKLVQGDFDFSLSLFICEIYMKFILYCGFARNGPDSTRFTRSNASIISACNTRSGSSFCQQQHLRYLAHVCRMENDALKKQLLFAPPRKKEVSHWKRLANDYKIDESQLRRTLFDKKAVNALLQATHGER